MNKLSKIVLSSTLILVTVCGGIFAFNNASGKYNLNNTSDKYNEEEVSVLDKLEDDIIYTRRDDDLTLKIYKSNSDLSNEKLLYEYKDSKINNNIIDISYNEKDKSINFVAYDDEKEDWMSFKYDKNGKVTKLNIYDIDKNMGNEEYNVVQSEKYKVEGKQGSLYITDKKTNKTELLKEFKGTYDGELATGFIPVKISDDSNFLFYIDNKIKTPQEASSESPENKTPVSSMYIMDLETKKNNEFVNFDDIIFIKK